MEKRKKYSLVKFPPEVIREAYASFCKLAESKDVFKSDTLLVSRTKETWTLDSEDEFYSEYRGDVESAEYRRYQSNASFGLSYNRPFVHETIVSVRLPTRQAIETVFEVFEENYPKYKLQEEQERKAILDLVKVYIGHGRSLQWRDLKDHLQDKQGFKVIAYETGARAGFTIVELLEGMANEASIAFMVHTGEDIDKDGTARARENVIHETGLFQGTLGFKRAIVLLEEGCNEFTNLQGLQQIRFSKGNIKETFGDVMAIVFREFGSKVVEL
jgi:predicted nucleotide-binding protein